MKLGGERGPQLTRAAGARYDFAALWEAAPATLEEIFLRGSTPHAADIAGWEYRGRNHAPIAEVIRVKRFTKVFSPLPPAPTVNPAPVISGHNLWVEQAGGPRDPWIPLTREGRPWRHGWYEVVPVDPRTVDGRYPHALLIDYGRGANPWHHPARVLRDYERAWRASDVDGLIALFTSDGVVMQPGRPAARGPEGLASPVTARPCRRSRA